MAQPTKARGNEDGVPSPWFRMLHVASPTLKPPCPGPAPPESLGSEPAKASQKQGFLVDASCARRDSGTSQVHVISLDRRET